MFNSNHLHTYQVWQKGNWPVLIESDWFFQQKLNYIHENPTRKEYVKHEEDWKYSSARNYFNGDHSVIEVITEALDQIRIW